MAVGAQDGAQDGTRSEQANGTAHETAHDRLLIVEDDASLTRLLQELFNAVGYAVTTTDSALGTTGLVRRLRPSVILLDLGLPYRSGVSLLADLKADPATANIPVLVITGFPDALTAERRAMVSDIMSKPLNVRALVETVRALCDLPK